MPVKHCACSVFLDTIIPHLNVTFSPISKDSYFGELLIFHRDRGCQYSSRSFQSLLEENNIRGSMSKSGCPYDNSAMESFFASLKKEYFSRREYATIEAVEKDLYYYIEIFYNRKRLHSTLGYMSPVAYRIKNAGKKSA